MNNTLGHFVMRSVVWRQLIRALRVYKRLLPLAALIVVPSIAHSGSQPPWVTDLNQVVIIGVEEESFSYRELIRELTLEAGAITGLALPMRLPLVTIADRDTVSKYACQGKCKAVGAFHPVYGIAIAKHMNPKVESHNYTRISTCGYKLCKDSICGFELPTNLVLIFCSDSQ